MSVENKKITGTWINKHPILFAFLMVAVFWFSSTVSGNLSFDSNGFDASEWLVEHGFAELWRVEEVKKALEEKGFKVISVGAVNYSKERLDQLGYSVNKKCDVNKTICLTDKRVAYAEIKSLGNKEDQLISTLITLGVYFPNALIYRITILSIEETCVYLIDGDIYRDYKEEDYNKLQSKIKQFKSCS